MRAWLALMLAFVLGLAGCAAGQASAEKREREPAWTPALADGAEPARSPHAARSLERAPHQAQLAIVDVVQLPSADDARGFAVLLRGDVGLSAVFRSLRIWAFTEPVAGSSCAVLPGPVVLHPNHEDAMEPALADETRILVVRSRGDLTQGARSWSRASFRYGPLPSLNGDFEGWVSFQFPVTSDDPGSCAFEVRGVVTVVAGETTSAVLPVVRIDSGRRLEGAAACDSPTAYR